MPSSQANEALSAFTSQALCGVQIGLFRVANVQINASNGNIVNLKKAQLARYFNDCWRSLILRDDEFVVDTFKEINEYLPTESPLCIIHHVFRVCCLLLDQGAELPHIGTTGPRDGSNGAFVNLLRHSLRETYKAASAALFAEHFTMPEYVNHRCCGPKFHDLTSEDPNEKVFHVEGI